MSERFRAGFIHPSVSAEFENSLILGMNRFRPDQSHVAQQSRRDKLRVQQTPVTGPTHLAAFPRGSEPDPDLIQVRDDSNFNDRVMLSSGTMLDFSSNAHDPSGVSEASYDDSSSQCPSFGSHLPSTSKAGYQHQNSGFWKGMNSQSQPTCDWIMNYVNGGAVQIPLFASQLYQKPGFSGFQGVQTPLNNLNNPSSELSSDHSQRQYMELPFSSPQFCQNTLQEVVTHSSSAVANQGLEMASGSWDSGGNELLLLRSHEEQTNGAPGIHNPTPWTSGQIHQWSSDGGFVGIKTGVSDNATKGLALSLSSNPPPDLQVAKFDGRFGEGDLPSNTSIDPNSKANKGGFRCSKSSLICGSKGSVGSVGPLGPFTGYATILKSSKFLKPAQNLLDEFCGVMAGPRLVRSPEPPERIRLGEITRSTCGTVGANNEVSMRGSSSSLYSSIQASGEWVTGSGASQVIHGPEFHQKKAKLMFMQEEVCRRYKQYHQQMQMVVSSFESVAGLSAATPYTSLALKAIWKHFRCLKNAISEQLRHITKVLGGNCISSPGSNLGETLTTPRLKFLDQALQKHKVGENGLGFLDRNQPVWRPQRGLPERSVAVLRAWLFEHFLHPYPTDTDKHMLASQTSLSRNQVSNWFINARVRLWKPMVEEIHMLETKGLMEVDLNSSKDDGKPAPDISERPESYRHYQANKLPYDSSAGATTNNLEYQQDEEEHQEKRLRTEECPISDAMDGGLLFGFSPYQHGFDMGGLGAVSLTLGLRHNEGAAYQQQQQMRRHFGDHMSHDFVG